MCLCNTRHDPPPRTPANNLDTVEVLVASLIHHRPPHPTQALPAYQELRPIYHLLHSFISPWSGRHWSWPLVSRCLHILRETHRACPSLTSRSQTRARRPQESSYCPSTSRRRTGRGERPSRREAEVGHCRRRLGCTYRSTVHTLLAA